ncbi:hypothetical protein AB9F26_20090 [Falsihalocynthiibacter sp. BN13B15]|uniref:hypothetical protein n=1 Tax=Falsihalocynthiibacter sp. BN13B15 TaxID=3240871 RepID=UPI00350FBCB8
MSTAASPIKSRTIAQVFGGEIRQDATLSGPASYDGAGRRFVFHTEMSLEAVAIDVELRSEPASAQLTKALGEDALARWTEIEVLAKLYDVPAHIVLTQVQSLSPQVFAQKFPAEILRCDTASHFIAVGRKG